MSWTGNSLKLVLLFFAMVVCPPIWIFFSLPLNIKMNKVPYVKFICRTVSHFFLLLLLVLTGRIGIIYFVRMIILISPACIPIDDIQSRTVYIPKWYEWLLLSKKIYHNEIRLLIFLYSLGIRITFDRANHCWRKNWSGDVKVGSFLKIYFN